MKRTVRILDCKECGYTWPSTADFDPAVCPKCKSPYWKKEKQYVYGNTVYDAGKVVGNINAYCATNKTNEINYKDLSTLISSCKTPRTGVRARVRAEMMRRKQDDKTKSQPRYK